MTEVPYVDPRSGALKNFLGIEDLAELSTVEGALAAARTAHYLGEVNAAHPFREGDGRTQRAFFRHLAREAGWNQMSPAADRLAQV